MITAWIEKRFRPLAAIAASLLLLTIFSCVLSTEGGHTYINVSKDSNWDKYDSVQISWKDTLGPNGGILFHGKTDTLAATKRILADDYLGGKIVVTIKGFRGDTLVYEQQRFFDGANPGSSTRKTVLPDPNDSTLNTGHPHPPRLRAISALPGAKVSIHDMVSFLDTATLDSGSLKSYSWSFEGDDDFTSSVALAGDSVIIPGSHRFDNAGLYHVALKVVSGSDSSIARLDIRVQQDLPAADAGQDTVVYANTMVNLHGAGIDTLGRIVKMEWKIGSAGFILASSSDTSFTAPSTFQKIPVKFKVTDDDGQSNTDSMTVYVISATESNLTELGVSKGRLAPAFAPGELSYQDTVDNGVLTLNLYPKGNGTIKVNDALVNSGAASKAIDLSVGDNTILVTVQIESMPIKTYTLHVYRTPLSQNVELSSLVPSVGTLSPAFRPDITRYSIQAGFTDSTVRVTPVAADPLSVIQVNGKPLTSGAASDAKKIQVGENPDVDTIKVTAQNQTFREYYVSVTRLPNSSATLKSLAVSVGKLASINALEFADTVSHGTTYITLTPVPTDANAKVTVNGVPVASGSASDTLHVDVGENSIKCAVTAQDGQTQTLYTVHVTRKAQLARSQKQGTTVSGSDSLEVFLGQANPLSAPAVTGYHFVRWTLLEGTILFGDSTVAATSATLSKGDARIQSLYAINTYTVAFSSTGCNLGKAPNKAAYDYNETVTLTLSPKAGYQNPSWDDHTPGISRNIQMDGDVTLSATCDETPPVTYTLTLGAPSNSGKVTATPAGPYAPGTQVQVKAEPKPGYHFVNWDGSFLSGTNNPASFTMNANHSVSANFAPDQFALNVTSTKCTVAKSPSQTTYDYGTVVTLTVTPDIGYKFSSWADGSTANPRLETVLAAANLSVTCVAIPLYALNLNVLPAAKGSVTTVPAGASFPIGTKVTLTANPVSGHHFVNWSGDVAGTTATVVIDSTSGIMNATANFALDQYTLTVSRDSTIPSACAQTGSGLVNPGVATAIATSSTCKIAVRSCGAGAIFDIFHFTNWTVRSGLATIASSISSNTTVQLNADAEVRANYSKSTECLSN